MAKDNKGFIMIPRGLLDDLAQGRHKFSKVEAFLYISSKARFSKGEDADAAVPCKRGQLSTSLRELADVFLWSEVAVRRFLLSLVKLDYIVWTSYKRATVITIKNMADKADILTEEKRGDAISDAKGDATYDATNSLKDKELGLFNDATTDAKGDAKGDAFVRVRCYNNLTDNNNINNNSGRRKEEGKEAAKAATSHSDACINQPKTVREKIMLYFNEKMATKSIKCIRSIENQRAEMLRARYKQFGEKAILEVIDKAAESSFLNGGSKRGFVATFDWLIRPNNFQKVWDGNYDDEKITETTIQQTDWQS